MLMDFQIEGGQALAAEIAAERQGLPAHYRTAAHESRTFELSASVGVVMFGSYGIFFTTLFLATGHGTAAIFALVISIAYTVMYFGTAAVLNSVSAAERNSLPAVEASDGIETQTGWMDNNAAYAQILTVPISLAAFACAFAIIRALV